MKRFTETNKWRDPWYRKLSSPAKQLWEYVCDNCDAAGVIEVDLQLASQDIGCSVTQQNLYELETRYRVLADGKLWIVGFIEFQYGKLSRDCRPHIPIFALLERHGISLDDVEQAPKSKKFGIPSQRRIRIINRDGMVCLYTGATLTLEEIEVDHLVSRRLGGTDDDTNLFVASREMNQKKADLPLDQFCKINNISVKVVMERVTERLSKGTQRVSIPLRQDKTRQVQEKEPEKEGVQGEEVEASNGKYHKDSRTVLHFLNETVGRHFRETDQNLTVISARLSEKEVELEGCKQMIVRQTANWKGTEMDQYLQPSTLFRASKFDGYYAARQLPPKRHGEQNGHKPTKPTTHELRPWGQ